MLADMRLSASMVTMTSPVAARAAALRIVAKFRLSSWTTLAPCATAISSVRSVQRLMATMTST